MKAANLLLASGLALGLALTLPALVAAGPLAKKPSPADVAEVWGVRHAGFTHVHVEARAGWHLNTAYPARLTLGDRKIPLSEAHLSEARGDTARGATWTVEGLHVSEGIVRAAFCDARSCAPPMDIRFGVLGGGGR